jgi:uncharacterized glyoxalase superfamily protein PhnB
MSPNPARAAIVPTLRYRDLPAAIDWLCDAFGFERHRVVKDTKGSVLYAQLTFGEGMVMVAPIQETAFGKLMVQPDEIGGVETQVCYLHVEDASAHQARATSAGADVILDIKAQANAGRGYSCRDLEGHIWNFGTFDPWDLKASPSGRPQRSRGLRMLALAVVLVAAGGAIYAHEPARAAAGDLGLLLYAKVTTAIETARASGREDGGEAQSLTRALSDLRDQLAKERTARLAADRSVNDLHEELVQVRRSTFGRDELMQARLALDITANKLAQALAEKEEALRSAQEARERLAELRSAKEASESAPKENRAQIVRQRRARSAAKRAAARKSMPPAIAPQPEPAPTGG